MKEVVLKNKIRACIKQNKNTPRVALTLNLSIAQPEKYAGQYSLMNRLLLKGTKKYNSEELSSILDENAIEFYTEMKSDYLRFRFICLNEDFKLALSIMSDIIKNSTFEEFEKEREKMKGERVAELDSARVKIIHKNDLQRPLLRSQLHQDFGRNQQRKKRRCYKCLQ